MCLFVSGQEGSGNERTTTSTNFMICQTIPKSGCQYNISQTNNLPQGFFDQMQFINCFVGQKDLANLPFFYWP
jgi:hypothetical protein